MFGVENLDMDIKAQCTIRESKHARKIELHANSMKKNAQKKDGFTLSS
jgi:plasmid stability protein